MKRVCAITGMLFMKRKLSIFNERAKLEFSVYIDSYRVNMQEVEYILLESLNGYNFFIHSIVRVLLLHV